ncbi:hypothetical protein VTN00DRAFT_3304 [Thermoascus crustaceus]|uniref:uncharacterized protein n=1 Tax=Thermoascus crustaceus TaxID=5088 RepID=UPI003742C2EC
MLQLTACIKTSSGLRHNPFPQPDNPWRLLELQGQTKTTPSTAPTLLRYFVDPGANMLTVDKYGKNALHQLLDGVDRDSRVRPPTISASLQYIATHVKRDGEYSIECYEEIGAEVLGMFEQAGARLMERNQAGKTLLHLVAGQKASQAYWLLKLLMSKGLDIMARDQEGKSALDIEEANEEVSDCTNLVIRRYDESSDYSNLPN